MWMLWTYAGAMGGTVSRSRFHSASRSLVSIASAMMATPHRRRRRRCPPPRWPTHSGPRGLGHSRPGRTGSPIRAAGLARLRSQHHPRRWVRRLAASACRWHENRQRCPPSRCELRWRIETQQLPLPERRVTGDRFGGPRDSPALQAMQRKLHLVHRVAGADENVAFEFVSLRNPGRGAPTIGRGDPKAHGTAASDVDSVWGD